MHRKRKHSFDTTHENACCGSGVQLAPDPNLPSLKAEDIDMSGILVTQHTGWEVYPVLLTFFMRHNSLNRAYSYLLYDLSFLVMHAKSQKVDFPIS